MSQYTAQNKRLHKLKSRRVFLMTVVGGSLGFTGCLGDSGNVADESDESSNGQSTLISDASSAVVSSISYRSDSVDVSYTYTEGDYEKQPETVTFQSDTEVFHEFTPTETERQTASFSPSEIANDPDNALQTLPTTQVVVEYDDGSSEVITEREESNAEGSSVFLNGDITIERYTNGETVVRVSSMDAEKLHLRSGEQNFHTFEEEGETITIKPEEAFAFIDGEFYEQPAYFTLVAESEGVEQRLQTFQPGPPPADVTVRPDHGTQDVIVDVELTTYDQLDVEVIPDERIDSNGDGTFDTQKTTVTEPTQLTVDMSGDEHVSIVVVYTHEDTSFLVFDVFDVDEEILRG